MGMSSPEAYLRNVIGLIADFADRPINRIAKLLPWKIGLVGSPCHVDKHNGVVM